ncbi:helix-turn-helix domain-containing protein [Sungkyunkwania multivorans]|uniref:Helix-turn-helix domain-containing protein n=1 Tax=Sungkyunkwania multivorans TaxID=1173618 RepID=A0ABW3D0J7_9FLAO
MTKKFSEFSTGALLLLSTESILENHSTSKPLGLYTFIWVKDDPITMVVDSVPMTIRPNQIISLTPLQQFQFLEGERAIVYQFNREFYCIKDHDQEVGCVGLLFFGNHTNPIIDLDKDEQRKFEMLHQIFLEEIDTKDTIQAEMLRMLLARFIIKTTRILKTSTGIEEKQHRKLDLYRSFNLLVESHFKENHSVNFYAEKLFKSPKTLSNSFASYNTTPLQVIHQRITLEAKRLLHYTNKTAKEIAYELGFDDASHLSRLFKKQTGQSPSQFRASK